MPELLVSDGEGFFLDRLFFNMPVGHFALEEIKEEEIKDVPGATPEGRFAPKIHMLRGPDHDDDH